MANDIYNNAGANTGNQNAGDVVVKLPGRGGANNGYKVSTERRVTDIDIATVKDKYDDRWDDPRYYQGDAAT